MRYILFFIVLVFSVGCSPKYVIKNQYIPPKEPSMLSCVNICAKDKTLCLQNCQTTYNICEQSAYSRAKDISNMENLKYEKSYAHYLYALKRYKQELLFWQQTFDKRYMDFSYFTKKCQNDKDKFACKRQQELYKELNNIKANKPFEPSLPLKPRFSDIYNQELQSCSKSCHCESIYDSCFVSCGGEIIPYKMCVSNCE